LRRYSVDAAAGLVQIIIDKRLKEQCLNDFACLLEQDSLS
jgi:hypothetical protein